MVHRDYGVFQFDVHGLRERATDALCVLAFKAGTDRVRQLVTLEQVAEAASADVVLRRRRHSRRDVSHVRGEVLHGAGGGAVHGAGAEYGIDAVALAVAA